MTYQTSPTTLPEIRRHLHEFLRAEHGQDALIVDELGLAAGRGRADVAAITSELHLYEIKGPRDSLKRLENQIAIYTRAGATATLVTSETHAAKAESLLPPWWGLLLVKQDEEGTTSLSEKRAAIPNTNRSPYTVAQNLWRQEALEELRKLSCATGLSRASRHYLWLRLAQVTTLTQLAAITAERMRGRDGWPGERRPMP